MDHYDNPCRGAGLPADAGLAAGEVRSDPSAVRRLFDRCPVAAPAPLQQWPGLADARGVGSLWLKDERERMGLGSFKALGAACVIAGDAARRADGPDGAADAATLAHILRDTVYVCASAGNHGLSVAAGARIFGARAVIHLADAVPEAFAERLRRRGAEVVRGEGDYEQSMKAAEDAARAHGWILLSDSSWPGYVDIPARVMEGYLIMGAEVIEAIDGPPTHVLLQAGVGGMAAAMAALFRAHWGDAPTVVVVEPTAAPALIESLRAGRPVCSAGPASNMGRLDCKAPSHLALAELARQADHFVTITDEQGAATVELLGRNGLATTPSGAAGVAVLQHAGEARAALNLDARSRVLAFISEGPEDAT